MFNHNRREFLADVGRGMLVSGLGTGVALDLGLATASAAEPAASRLTFDKLEPLVSLMQETPLNKLLPVLVAKLNDGVALKTLVAAGALANARTFGGQDYTGYHAFMALPPALEIANEMPDDRSKALPVLKVLYRNSARIQQHGGTKNEVLHPIATEVTAELTGETLQAAIRKADMTAAEAQFAKLKNEKDAFNALQWAIQDEVDVHRVVLSWRAWTMLDIAGHEYAHTLLRQSVRFCVDNEKQGLDRKRPESGIRTLLPKLFDEQKLAGKLLGTKKGDAVWMLNLSDVVFGKSREKATEAVAMALAEGYDPEAVGEAISLAAAMLVLRDPGRTKDEEGKPKGSVHGASVGVHASDSSNAWRNIARVSNARNTFASLIVGAYHTAGQSAGMNLDALPQAKIDSVDLKDPAAMLKAIDSAVLAKDQLLARTLAQSYGDAGYKPQPLFALLRKYAVSEDGALHAEKYYRTVSEEFPTTNALNQWRHLQALARVTASEYGFTAPGYAEATRLLKV
ncbi:hypothetical protein BH11PLA2_BH11PLA2_35900 [soil metagenome]